MRSNRVAVEREVKRLLARKNAAAGIVVSNEAKRLAPVDTGRLRSSIVSDSDETGAVVGSNLSYFPYVELGTRYQSPQPTLVPGLVNAKNQLKRVYEGGS